MLDAFLLVGLPYLAIFVLVAGSIYRFRRNRFSYSALSSQFLENRRLLWGSVPWHIGILIVLVGHIIPLSMPGLWKALTANRALLLTVEAIGLGASLLAIFGLTVLIVRRVTTARLQPVTSIMDVAILVLLMGQILLGVGVAVTHRWGAAWAPGTLSPYLASILTFRPDMSYVAEMPGMIKLHLAGAWIILLLLPFSRLVHIFSLPIGYLWRPPQKVVWTNPRRERSAAASRQVEESRRYFLKAAFGLGAAGTLLSVGVLDKLVRYFRGPDMTTEEEATLLAKRLKRLEMTAEERQLELERMRAPYIFVARLNELTAVKGKYFIDYQMRPAMAFVDGDGLPLLISAKCTHLGCTVASDVDAQGRVLCPCHISYFDLRTGAPNAGSPAKGPLPHIGWVLMDPQGNIVASKAPGRAIEGAPEHDKLDTYSVYIARQFEEKA